MSGATPALTDTRTAADVEQQLVARARAWLPEWQFDEIPGDFGRALLTIAARMYGRVIDALARTPEKNQRGLLWWLGIGPTPPQAASMPVFFQLTPQADVVTAPQGTRVQASPAQTIFETLDDVRVVPGTIAAVVGADPSGDQYFVPSAGLPATGPPTETQTQWTTLAPVAFPPTVVQLSSANGLAEGQILLIAGQEFRITGLQSNVVTLSAPGPADPTASAAPASLPAGTIVALLDVFAPFAVTALGTQEHSLLLGDDALLNLPGSATIDVTLGSGTLPAGVSWSYWGGQTAGWQPLTATSAASGALTLTKTPGAAAQAQFAGVSTYCLKATLPGASSGTVELSAITLRVRSGTGAVPSPCASASPCPDDSKPAAQFLKYNAMWNNTPIVVSPGFLPLGPMPRLSDSFYIGCAEAFGKAGAFVTLCFEVPRPRIIFLAAWPAAAMMFGVGEDGQLQRLQLDSKAGTVRVLRATQPKASDVGRGRSTSNPIPLHALPTPPPVVASSPHAAAVLVCSSHRVWMWTERPGSDGFWTPLGESDTPIEGLIALRAARGVRVIAVADGRLRWFELQPDRPPFNVVWEELPEAFADGKSEYFRTIAAVRTASEDFSEALVAVAASGRLWRFGGGAWHTVEAFAGTVDAAVAPLAVTLGKQAAYIVKMRGRDQLAAWRSGSDAAPVQLRCELQFGLEALHAASGELTVLMLTREGSEAPRVSWWRPFGDGEREILFSQDPPAGPRPLAGTPAVLGELIVTAGVDGVLFVGRVQPDAHGTVQARDMSSAALVPAGAAELRSGELLARMPQDSVRAVSRCVDVVRQEDGSYIARLDGRLTRPDAVRGVRVLTLSAPSVAKPRSGSSIIVAAGGAAIGRDDTLMLGRLHEEVVSDARLYDVRSIEEQKDGIHVTLDRPPHLSEDVRVWVVEAGETIPAAVRPAILVSALPASVAHAGANLDHGALYAEDSDPERLEIALAVAATEPFAVLAANWKRLPKQKLVFDLTIRWPFLPVVPTFLESPRLQWQYWNGAGWTPIPGIDADPVDQLIHSGPVTFTVPSDLKTTVVAGKLDAWIRASLVAGNYGLEKYDVTRHWTGRGWTYTSVPDDSAVKPPVLNSIDISYQICEPQAPAYVVSYDNGCYGDQSDANRAGASAVVRAFVPLAEAFDSTADTVPSATTAVAGGCGCGCAPSPTAPTSSGAADTSTTASTGSAAIYVGFDQQIDPGLISLLWQVDEEDFTAVMPLQVAGVGQAGQMIPFTSGDYTRALGETQVIDVDISVALPQINLFGQSLYWLRLQPARAGSWSPQILGVYLNGVWAAAQQTQLMEKLGSSTGAPSASFSLLTTPVLDGTLELRVSESLSDADLAALQLGNPDRVQTDPGNLTGDWVLWQQVPDLGASQPTDRVYTLDDVAGLITFGDGVHGMVPPVGQSNIIAFAYKSGGGAAANAFPPWGQLSLVSPVPGVSAVLGPEAAAGGADATPIPELLGAAPAMIAQRGRAVTPRDLEQLALQSSPAIAQARCWQTGSGLRLVILVTGGDGAPSLAQMRALNAYLEARMTPALAAALDVVAPRLVVTQITISGSVTTFDAAAQVSLDVESALADLFDPETGGVDGGGWPLGRAPMSDDIVAVLGDIENLTAIVSISLEQIDAQGNSSPLPVSFDPDQFPVLAASGVQFNILPAAA